jgi:hypothetical protein
LSLNPITAKEKTKKGKKMRRKLEENSTQTVRGKGKTTNGKPELKAKILEKSPEFLLDLMTYYTNLKA